jgi:hypothetical protein
MPSPVDRFTVKARPVSELPRVNRATLCGKAHYSSGVKDNPTRIKPSLAVGFGRCFCSMGRYVVFRDVREASED